MLRTIFYKVFPMKQSILIILSALILVSCSEEKKRYSIRLFSPSHKTSISFLLSPGGTPGYCVQYKDQIIVDSSSLGFELKEAAPIKSDFEMIGNHLDSLNENWEQPWGEQRIVNNHYNELTVNLREKIEPHRLMNLIFRSYDDGVAFRYEFPDQEAMREMTILEENTKFRLKEDYTCWWAPGDWDITEHLYTNSFLSKIDATKKRNHPSLGQTYIPDNAVNTPLTMRSKDGLHISIHEAALVNYSDMTLKVDTANLQLQSSLVGSDRLGYKAKVQVPFKTPWRMILLSPNAAGLVDSRMILNLNEPSKVKDVSWFKPMKYTGIWWEMHLGKSSWDMASGKHGATTANAKKYIDFTAKNGLGGVLVEGWNTGWEHWIGFDDREGVFDFVTPYADYNLEEVVQYAHSKGVEIIMHHETSSAPQTYEKQLDKAFALMKRLGLHTVKTGYVGKILPKGEYHHGQWMINHYQKVIETAAKYQIAVDAHEPIKGTGLQRTWPNFVSREGMRGQEFNAWSSDGGNPPDHLPNVVFTRMLSGPFDFTPGVFNIKLKPYKDKNQVSTTLAQQLALYVVIYSPVQMACDLIENYEGQPGFQFIRDVGTDWESSKTLAGEVGDFVTIVRQEKKTGNWFLGSITDENARDISVDFSFLPKGIEFTADVYKDGTNAHWDSNPTSLQIDHVKINSTTKLDFHLAPGGGLAIAIKK